MASDAFAVAYFPDASNARKWGVLNSQVFASPFEASLNEIMVTYSSDLMDNRVHVTQQRALLKFAQDFIQEFPTRDQIHP